MPNVIPVLSTPAPPRGAIFLLLTVLLALPAGADPAGANPYQDLLAMADNMVTVKFVLNVMVNQTLAFTTSSATH